MLCLNSTSATQCAAFRGSSTPRTQVPSHDWVRNSSTVPYYLYGLGGEGLMEFQETCTGGACGYTDTRKQRCHHRLTGPLAR